MIDRYDEAARANGVVLVPSSGFDSIPSDIACQWMAERLAVRFGRPARRVSAYVAMQGGMSGGTVLSGILSEEAFGRSPVRARVRAKGRPCASFRRRPCLTLLGQAAPR